MDEQKKKIFNILYSFILIPLFLVISIYFTMACFGSVTIRFISIKCAIFNFVIIDILNLLLSLITKSTKKSLIIISILIYLLCFINQLKIDYMSEPIYLSDINFIQNYNNITTFTSGSIIGNIFMLLIKTIPLILFILFISFIADKFNIEISVKYRLISSTVIIITLALILYPFSITKSLYFKYVYTDIARSIDEYADYKDLYAYYGIFGGIHYQYINSKIDYKNPKGYDKKKLEEIENVEESEKLLASPNIVIVLSESFFNINKLEDDIKFSKNVVENYERLAAEENYVNVISPAHGGQTANIVFELLTGGNISYFSAGYVPFQDLYRDRRQRPSLVNVLKNNGYKTSLTVGADSYNSDNIMKDIGFDEFTIADEKIKGDYASDDYMADLIISELKKESKKNFIMVETMQNHMPYYAEKYKDYEIEITSTTLNKEDSEIVKSYAEGLYDADKMLKKVYDYINEIEEETILLFFGDHLPLLKNIKLENIDYFNTEDSLINTYRKYATGALILSNFEMNIDFPENLGYDLLLNYIVNNMDIKVPNYYRWLYKTSKDLPTYNRFVAINKDGNLISTNKLSKEEKEILNLRNMMFYKNFIER